MVILNYLGEIWKDIPEFEGQYQASNLGRIKSLYYGKERILKQQTCKGDYKTVYLTKNNITKCFIVSVLIWKTFHGNIPKGMQVNHIDENKTNNRLDNLNLMTCKENNNWGTRNERVSKKMTNGKTSKAVLQYTLEGELIKEFPSINEIKRQTGFYTANISRCCLGKAKSAYGYIWKYK